MKNCPWHPQAPSKVVFEYSTPPEGEIALPASTGAYFREFRACSQCGHYFGDHALDLTALYSADYVGATYGGEAGLRKTYDRVTALPQEKSDNAQRVIRLREFLKIWNPSAQTLLDIGSGTGVFPGAMKRAGFHCLGMDLDPRQAAHLQDYVGVSAICGNFLEFPFDGKFDLITFNKVLEHLEQPVPFLQRAASLLGEKGLIYVELPDGPAAAASSLATGKHREEFDIDHFHAFSAESLRILAEKSGTELLLQEHVVEPSGKFTLRGFLSTARRKKAE